MSVDAVIARLDAKRTGPDHWVALCPSHADAHASLSVRALDDGRILLHCFAECAPEDVLAALGMDFDALFPPRALTQSHRPELRPFFPSDVFTAARGEIAVVAVIAADMYKQREISEADYDRLLLAVERLEEVSRAAYSK